MLYRAFYKRQGQPRTVTFQADDLVELTDFICLWERMARVQIDSWQEIK